MLFWTIVAAVVGAVGVAVAVLALLRQRAFKQLAWFERSRFRLFQQAGFRDDFALLLRTEDAEADMVIPNPVLLEVEIWNSGNQAIDEGDFREPIRLLLNGARVLDARVIPGREDVRTGVEQISALDVTLTNALLNPGASFIAQLVLAAPPQSKAEPEIDVVALLLNGRVRRRDPDWRPAAVLVRLASNTLTGAVINLTALLGVVALVNALGLSLVEPRSGLLFGALFVAVVIATSTAVDVLGQRLARVVERVRRR